MSVIHNDLLLATDEATGYNLTKSLRFRSSASAYLNRTNSGAGNTSTWTWSAWVKRGSLGSGVYPLFTSYIDTSNYSVIDFSADTLRVLNNTTLLGEQGRVTTQVFRDPSAWYHIVVSSTAASAPNVYVNGVQVTSFSSSYAVAGVWKFSSTNPIWIGREQYSASNTYFDGYICETNYIDGQALTPSSFGETDTITGVWKPKRYAGTYGTNGFYLPFTDVATTSGSNAGLGKDFSGNGNYWTTNNISVTSGATYDSMTDVPTLTSATAANYCVWNPLNGGSYALANGNLQTAGSGATSKAWAATLSVNSGKWYYEYQYISSPATNGGGGVWDINSTYTANSIPDSGTGTRYVPQGGGAGNIFKFINGSSTLIGTFASYTTGDVIGVAFDCGSGTVSYYKNNTLQTTITDSNFVGKSLTPVIYTYTGDVAANFGQQPFAYTPPTGYVALNTYNLPDSTIVAGNKVMDATTFTGNASGATVTNAAGFKPDLVWMKNRAAARNNELLNSVTGGSATLFSNLTNAEATDQRISSFNSNGFTYTSNSNSANTGEAVVGWQWQAGQGTTSSNTNGSITSTVSVNASAGFSIVTYTGNGTAGATVGHGLGVAPSLVICKNRQVATSWPFYHSYLGGTNWLLLNSTSATTTSSQEWNNTNPTSSVFSIGSSSSNSNQSANTYVAYCWSEISGYSKFGGYTGNSNSDGVFIYLGFRPKFIFIKNYQSATDWYFEDSSRDTYNVASSVLLPNSSAAETTGTYLIDFLSNGFKIRTANGNINSSVNSYIYGCWAENPFKNSLAR